MTKAKRNYLVVLLLAIALLIAGLSCVFSSNNSLSASAATTDKYLLTFNYSTSKQSYGQNTPTTDSGSGTSLTISNGNSSLTRSFSLYLYGSSYSSTTTTAAYGAYFNFNTINIIADTTLETATTYSYSKITAYSLTNSSGTAITSGSGTTSLYSGTLSDGTYTLSVTWSACVCITSSANRTWKTLSATITYSFTIDGSAPTISGASTSTTGLYTNSSFTVTATDSGSGVSKLYYKSPMASGYSSTTSVSKTYSTGVTNGLYSFYAEDKAGNTSSTYYVYYDNTAPTLSVSGATFGSSTGTSFTVTSSDSSGTTTTLYYRKGSSGSFTKASSTSYTVSSTAGDDTYYFYATDKAGNTSSTYLVTLSTEAVSGEFVKSDTDNTVFFYWTNNSWTATLDGSSYTSGTWITEEGEHTIVLTSPTTGSTTYTRTIDHNYEAYQTVAATCTSQGYTIFKCSQCGDTYNGNYTDKAAHTYVAATTSATCTSQGYTTYTCSKCGDSYVGNYTSKTSHTYRSVVTAPTCTARGYTTYTCTRCGYSYKSNYTAATGHTYETMVVDATCTEQGYTIYTCSVCGYSYNDDYTETIPHSYQSTYIAPSCTEGGYMEYTCVNCGDKYTDETTLPTGHTYTITVIKSATCTETGLRHYCCDECGYEYDAVIPATGHNYVITDVENNDGETTRTYECSDCGDSYSEDLGNQTEYVASYVEYLFDGYSNYIWWLLLATVGIWSIVMGVFFAIATKNEDKQKACKMVVNYLIGLVVIAVILVAAPYLAYGIAVLVT